MSTHASPSAPLGPHTIASQIDGPSPLGQYPHHTTPSGSTVHQPSPAELDFDALFKQFEEGGAGNAGAVGHGQAAPQATAGPSHEATFLDFDLNAYAAEQQRSADHGQGKDFADAQDQTGENDYAGQAGLGSGQVGLGIGEMNGVGPGHTPDWQLDAGDHSFADAADGQLPTYAQYGEASQGHLQPHAQSVGSYHSHGGSQASHSSGPGSTNVVAQDPAHTVEAMAGFEAFQASLLQQQLEQIHMQTPAMLAQQSQDGQASGAAAYGQASGQSANMDSWMTRDDSTSSMPSPVTRQQPFRDQSLSMAIAAGQILTPAQSSEMFPSMHQELVSPLPAGMWRRPDGTIAVEERPDPAFTPLMSPALKHFRSSGGNMNAAYTASEAAQPPPSQELSGEQQLLAIRLQEEQLQRQLDRLHVQQQQIMRSTTSPYVSPSEGQPSGQPQPNMHAYQSLDQAQYVQRSGNDGFSPLTSPALRPRSGPRPAQAMTRPNATGVQQTLSPGLGPQASEWQGSISLDQLESLPSGVQERPATSYRRGTTSGVSTPAGGRSPVVSTWSAGSAHGASQASARSTPAMSPSTSTGPGPHRTGHQSARTRPSPLIKPAFRGGRTPGMHAGQAVPPSPLIPGQAGKSPYHYAETTMSQNTTSTGTGSTPSPVDLNHLSMPPPAPPGANGSYQSNGNSQRRSGSGGFAPVTPASLMRMGPGDVKAIDYAHRLPGISEVAVQNNSNGRGRKSSLSTNAMQGAGNNTAQVPAPQPARTTTAADRAKAAGTASRLGIRPIAPHAQPPTIQESPMLSATKGKAGAKAGKKVDDANLPPEVRKTSHKAAEQKRRDSLKAGFDELRLLLPPINTEALDPESGEPIPGSSAPRLLPKNSLVPDDNPNKGVSKVALLKYSNEYIGRLHAKIDRRNDYIELLKEAIRSTRQQTGFGYEEHTQDLLDYAFEDEEEDDEPPTGVTDAANKAQHDATMEGDDSSGDPDMSRESSPIPSRGKAPRGNKRLSMGAGTRRKDSDRSPALKPEIRGDVEMV